MSYLPEALRVYPSGTVLTAKTHPEINLKVVRYYQRIYYCALVNNPQKNFVYYEHELNPPAGEQASSDT